MLDRASVITCLPESPAPRPPRRRPPAGRGQSGEIRFAVEDEGVGFLVGQDVLGELRAEARQPLGDGREARLRIRREARTGLTKIV